MFHRFKLRKEDDHELVAVGVVMPSSTVFVEYLEQDAFTQEVREAEAYPNGILEFTKFSEQEPDVAFFWEDNPRYVLDPKVETTAEDVYENVPEQL